MGNYPANADVYLVVASLHRVERNHDQEQANVQCVN